MILACGLLPLTADRSALTAQQASPAARVAKAVDPDVIRGHLLYLADDALEGRAPGTRGGDLAAKYVAAQFARLGLKPAGDDNGYLHRVLIVSLDPSPQASIVSGGREWPLEYERDYVMWSMHDDSVVSTGGDLVFAGYGIVAPEYGWNDYEGTDVKGKVVVVLVNTPGLRDSTLFRGKYLTYYGRWTYKIEEAERQGAAGLLMVHTTPTATYGWATVTGSWTGPQTRVARKSGPLVVAGWLSESASDRLLQPAGGLQRLAEAASRKGFRPVPLDARLGTTVRSAIQRSETYNVLGRRPGRGPKASEAVIIGGHYDHLGFGPAVNGDSVYNGAEDNASGTAAVLAAAEAFHRSGVTTARSIVFMAFAAEESGLLGSTAYAARPSIPLRNIAAVLNMDGMNLYGRARDIAALGLDQSTLGRAFTAAARAEGLRVSVNEDALIKGYFFRSDHFPLARVGVPAISLQKGLDIVGRPAGWGQQQEDEYTEHRYHQPDDEILDWFSYDGAAQQLRVIARTAVLVAEAPRQPKWAAGSEFREAGEARVR
ncbi:MAG TPA: M20/M25/M40 family metallo-hydrolase [Gemmatimonadales bacterium]|nr:M20/M25/M40 family metallo-hydrolase [Gemmatimonadales bacterium]